MITKLFTLFIPNLSIPTLSTLMLANTAFIKNAYRVVGVCLCLLSINASANNLPNSDTAELIFDNLATYQSFHRGAKKLRYQFSYEQCNIYITKDHIVANAATPISSTQYSIPLNAIASAEVNSTNTKITLKTANGKDAIFQLSKKKDGSIGEHTISWVPLPIQKDAGETQMLVSLLVERCKTS